MKYQYEMACQEAGLTEEQIAEIRKFFDREKKKMKRDLQAREKQGIGFHSLEDLEEKNGRDCGNGCDAGFDLEEMVIHRMDIEKLDRCLNELSMDDREFIYAIFSMQRGAIAKISRETGTPRTTLNDRKKRILRTLKEKFLKS